MIQPQVVEDAEREFFGHLLPRYLRRVYKAPSAPMSVEVFREILLKRQNTESSLAARLVAKVQSDATREAARGSAASLLEERIAAAKESERAMAKSRVLAAHQQRLEDKGQAQSPAPTSEYAPNGKNSIDKEEKIKTRDNLGETGNCVEDKPRSSKRDKCENAEEIPVEGAKRRRVSSSKDDCALARPSNECVDDRLMESIKIHEDGCSTLEPSFGNTELDTDVETKTTSGQDSRERRVSDEMMDDEVMDSEQAKLVEELRTQLDRLADTKHELMLNLKRVLNSESEAALSGSHDRPKPPEEPGPDSTSQQGLLHPSTSAAADIDSQSEISLEEERPSTALPPPPPLLPREPSPPAAASSSAPRPLPPPPPLPAHMIKARMAKQAAASAASFAAQHNSRHPANKQSPAPMLVQHIQSRMPAGHIPAGHIQMGHRQNASLRGRGAGMLQSMKGMQGMGPGGMMNGPRGDRPLPNVGKGGGFSGFNPRSAGMDNGGWGMKPRNGGWNGAGGGPGGGHDNWR
mmetsp:Transcript_21538/g.41079  ORF Transcript_21538/g.41079 Transcript_21538/m.41079 type:complete len:519 (-) Transcript_21538:718-2274(-)|eukprot:CAMPEP_0114247514 /NCGR_PEP_ID=MMETSP0058-20121206/13064_1 /TAXON_ID=36894 /ORGANISM="Pyramimonas parkeae, CCMP726" /LENGTH=518 /DNA_ID=CAMNT_0001360827 /DNA_START=129 /DNA_END=1685 /DNA_ORIENTATION=-